MSAHRVALVALNRLRGHEATDPAAVRALIGELQAHPVLQFPIVVDARTRVILDGHHRHAAFQELGLRKIPCLMVDYDSDDIQVEARRPNRPVSKAEVRRRARSGALYPPKTTRHRMRPAWATATCRLPLRIAGRLRAATAAA